MQIAKRKNQTPLGRLKSFGLSAPWQVALFLPSGWDDLTRPLVDFSRPIFPGDTYVVVGQLIGDPQVRFGSGAPRLTGYLTDPHGRRVGFSAFGDTRTFEDSLKANREKVVLVGQMDIFNERPWLKNPEIVSPSWLGRIRPRYSGKTGVINPETVRDRVLGLLRGAVPMAAKFLEEELKVFGSPTELVKAAGVPDWSLDALLYLAHIPHTVEEGKKAQEALERLAAMGILASARINQTEGKVRAFLPGNWKQRAASISFPLTDEQEAAIEDACRDMATHEPMRRLLTGDVGTGKTAVFGTVCAAVADGQGKSIILLPNFVLAGQVAREMSEWWPDLRIQVVTGETKDLDPEAAILVGTTALLHRTLPWKADLVVVDEQQKFSREQREQLIAANTNLLESTATCIPRSMALARYGVVKVSKLTQCHAKKTLHTRVWYRDQWAQLFSDTMNTLRSGSQVLLVYPLREKGEEDKEPKEDQKGPQKELRSAAEVFDIWEKKFPGRVRLLHGQMSDSDKDAALRDMREGRADVCISTTVVEIGVTIPNLRRVIVVHPERHGLTTLHQIRGRLARLGGEGWCDLFLPYHVKEQTMERLRVLERTTDGFEIAEWDMKLRGVGDLSKASDKQSGSDDTFLFGRPVRMEILDEVMETLSR